MDKNKKKVLEISNLTASFNTYAGEIHAVRDVSFDIYKGEILAVVGESGCGKSVTAKSIIRLNPQPPCIYKNGRILYKNKDLLSLNNSEIRKIRGGKISIIFQDPMSSLNPTMKTRSRFCGKPKSRAL